MLEVNTYVKLESGKAGRIIGYGFNLLDGHNFHGRQCYYLVRLDQDYAFLSEDKKEYIQTIVVSTEDIVEAIL